MLTDGRTYSRTVLEWSQVRPDYTLPTKAISYKPTELGGSARAVGAVGTHTEQLTSLCAVLHSDRVNQPCCRWLIALPIALMAVAPSGPSALALWRLRSAAYVHASHSATD